MLGILAGTSLLESDLFKQYGTKTVDTPYGTVLLFLSTEEVGHGPVAFCQRHDLDGKYAPPHRINHHANLAALKQVGVTHLIGVYSVGSLHERLQPGTVLLADDYFHPWDPATFNEGQSKGKFVTPTLDESLRERVVAQLEGDTELALSSLVVGGTYVQTRGPRFETKAEVRVLSQYGDVVGMTGAKEADLALELEIPHAMLCMVDNYANGVTSQPLSFDAFKTKVEANRGIIERIVSKLVLALAREA